MRQRQDCRFSAVALKWWSGHRSMEEMKQAYNYRGIETCSPEPEVRFRVITLH